MNGYLQLTLTCPMTVFMFLDYFQEKNVCSVHGNKPKEVFTTKRVYREEMNKDILKRLL